MKKKNVLMVLFAMLTLFNMPVSAIRVLVPLQIGYVDPEDGNHGENRSPVSVPEVTIDDKVLAFITPCDGDTLRIVNENGVVVYSTTIPVGCEEIELPSNLSGDYEIQLIRGNFCFFGYLIF
jgi:hypothetical protein